MSGAVTETRSLRATRTRPKTPTILASRSHSRPFALPTVTCFVGVTATRSPQHAGAAGTHLQTPSATGSVSYSRLKSRTELPTATGAVRGSATRMMLAARNHTPHLVVSRSLSGPPPGGLPTKSITRTASRTATFDSRSGSASVTTAATATGPVPVSVRPLRYEASEIGTGLDRAVAAVTVAFGAVSPSVATMAGRQMAIRALIGCTGSSEGDDIVIPPGSDTNALQWRISSVATTAAQTEPELRDALELHAGAVMLCAVYLAASLIIVALVVGVHILVNSRGSNVANASTSERVSQALAWCRFPGVLAFVVAYTSGIAGPSSAAVAASGFAQGTAIATFVGVACLVAFAPVAVGVFTYMRHFRRTFISTVPTYTDVPEAGETRDVDETADIDEFLGLSAAPSDPCATPRQTEATDSPSAFRNCCDRLERGRRWLLDSTCVWAATSLIDAAHGSDLMRRFSMFFDAYGSSAPWFLAAEVGFLSVIGGTFAQLGLAVGCSAAAWLTFAVYAAHVIAMCVYRPYSMRLELAAQFAVAAAQAVSVLLAAIKASSGSTSTDVQEVADAIASMAAGILICLTILSVVIAVPQCILLRLAARNDAAVPSSTLDDSDASPCLVQPSLDASQQAPPLPTHEAFNAGFDPNSIDAVLGSLDITAEHRETVDFDDLLGLSSLAQAPSNTTVVANTNPLDDCVLVSLGMASALPPVTTPAFDDLEFVGL
jgi:hypothetical protein